MKENYPCERLSITKERARKSTHVAMANVPEGYKKWGMKPKEK